MDEVVCNADKHKKFLIDFLDHLEKTLKLLGNFTEVKDSTEVCKEIVYKFYNNLICLKNYLDTKDFFAASLIQRYNHELVMDFFYLINPGGESDKIKKFFGFNFLSTDKQWSSKKVGDKRKFIPPWVAKSEQLESLYKGLSILAHPNIVSIRKNRENENDKYALIKNAITFCIFDTLSCLNHKPFRDILFNEKGHELYVKENREFMARAVKLV